MTRQQVRPYDGNTTQEGHTITATVTVPTRRGNVRSSSQAARAGVDLGQVGGPTPPPAKEGGATEDHFRARAKFLMPNRQRKMSFCAFCSGKKNQNYQNFLARSVGRGKKMPSAAPQAILGPDTPHIQRGGGGILPTHSRDNPPGIKPWARVTPFPPTTVRWPTPPTVSATAGSQRGRSRALAQRRAQLRQLGWGGGSSVHWPAVSHTAPMDPLLRVRPAERGIWGPVRQVARQKRRARKSYTKSNITKRTKTEQKVSPPPTQGGGPAQAGNFGLAGKRLG